MNPFYNQWITNFTLSVDTFFVLSATLTSYIWFKKMHKCPCGRFPTVFWFNDLSQESFQKFFFLFFVVCLVTAVTENSWPWLLLVSACLFLNILSNYPIRPVRNFFRVMILAANCSLKTVKIPLQIAMCTPAHGRPLAVVMLGYVRVFSSVKFFSLPSIVMWMCRSAVEES